MVVKKRYVKMMTKLYKPNKYAVGILDGYWAQQASITIHKLIFQAIDSHHCESIVNGPGCAKLQKNENFKIFFYKLLSISESANYQT